MCNAKNLKNNNSQNFYGLPVNVKLTPMLSQWLAVKKKAKDAILLFRMGDFYELFGVDAEISAPLLNLVLTSRDKNKNEKSVKMAGFPWHCASGYIAKLVAAGFKVAICEQLESQNLTKGIIKRDITRIVTPGTISEEDGLLEKANNYIVGLVVGVGEYGISSLQVSTGEFLSTICNNEQDLIDELGRLSPSEVVLAFYKIKDEQRKKINKILLNIKTLVQIGNINKTNNILKNFTLLDRWFYDKKHKKSLFSIKILLNYIKETQGSIPSHIQTVKPYLIDDQLIIDATTRSYLNIGDFSKSKQEKGTLIHLLDYSKTAMGGRYLARILLTPSTSIKVIKDRQCLVGAFLKDFEIRYDVRDALKKVYDLERLLSKCATRRISPQEIGSLRETLGQVPVIINKLKTSTLTKINKFAFKLKFPDELFQKLNEALVEDPSLSLNSGPVFLKGFDLKLDELIELCNGGRRNLANIEQIERKKTNINSLKIKYTKFFGYYIEITKINLSKVPSHYIRKQTTINSERFVTKELQYLESQLLNTNSKKQIREKELFIHLCDIILKNSKNLISIAKLLAKLDAFLAFAEVSDVNNYVCPKILPKEKKILQIVEGRHPVMENLAKKNGEVFVTNNITIDSKKNQIILITGPNMGGKSTIMRQLALLQLMAQTGCFVPALKAVFSICDRIFSRVDLLDDINRGRSTFMVEMLEISHILKHASKYSLVLIDEMGRGTSTFDGLSLAWAVVEYIHEIVMVRTIFATHYHELTELVEKMSNCKNMHVDISKENNKISFLYRLVAGSAVQSYGINVAKLAGLPESILNRANDLILKFEKNKNNSKNIDKTYKIINENIKSQLNLFSIKNIKHIHTTKYYNKNLIKLLKEIITFNINKKTPIDCLNKILAWKKNLKQ